ncbi:CBS domain-containing protein [Prosthecobacter sp.]|uniref:CBS domain-containing protein n=1 Tax=Prosthecobacter sp. TaxID=1965333 RepID=UPI0024878A5F|nr:CBS domain-containing protein [Prosthecobacter sp.]MDI1312809.1 CBS domain-containing protein [Prosthecobacter sp.]
MPDQTSKPASPDKSLMDVLLHKAGILKPQDSMQTAGDRMRAGGHESMPVADNLKLVGMVTDPNPDQQVMRFGHDPSRTPVSESMDKKILFCFEDEDCTTALLRMDENGVKNLPVMKRDMKMVGVVSREEIVGISDASKS